MPKLRKFLVSCTAVVALAAGIGPAYAGNGGNSSNAQACQQGGWQNWRRADQTPFTNTGDCVSYAARGGTLTAPAPPPGGDDGGSGL
jgi:hypothetical protein